MRILFLTSHYTPSPYGGGYAQLCEEVADGLHARGHQIAVLTSTYGRGSDLAHPYPVLRRLPIDPDWISNRNAAWQFFVGRRRRERQATGALQELLTTFAPQIVFVWHAIGLSREMLRLAENWPGVATAYYLANYLPEIPDEHLAYWQAAPKAPPARLLKRPLSSAARAMLRLENKPVLLRFENTACVSDYVRRRLQVQGLIGSRSVVIHNGVDLTVFSRSDGRKAADFHHPLRCLVAGRVDPEKGIHTVVQAFGLLTDSNESPVATLTILGDGPTAYVASLRDASSALGVEPIVRFRPAVARSSMPSILQEHDVLILASEYAEPLARAAQEAMAMGLLLIGTTTGGSGELLVHGRTGLAFQAGTPASLARQIERAASDPQLARCLALAGRCVVRKQFDIRRTVMETERYVQGILVETREQERGGAAQAARTGSP